MERALLKIHGIVQGVGFRPFIHKLVGDYALAGYIKNTSSGVELEVEGERDMLEHFISDVPLKAPKLALIEKMEVEYFPEAVNYSGFEIRKSLVEQKRRTLISPDVCICEDCLRELFDPADRRYRYPFINCTNCGPRFTIINDMPYDRPLTSMASFPMCEDCAEEYQHIENRRYHAQPTCCPDCGPALTYVGGVGQMCSGDPLEQAKAALKQGKIVAVKGLGGFHLACLPNTETVSELRRRKHRDEKPFALMCADLRTAQTLCEVGEEETRLLTCWRSPIVLLKKKAAVPHGISDNRELGIMLPYTPLHHLLMEDFDALVMTSANLSDDPVIIDNDEAMARLRGIADGFLIPRRKK